MSKELVIAVMAIVLFCGCSSLPPNKSEGVKNSEVVTEEEVTAGEIVLEGVIQDFEDYADTKALRRDISHIKSGASVSLLSDDGIDDSPAMSIVANVSEDPWYTQIELEIPKIDLSKISTFTLYVKRLPGTSNEKFEVQLKTKYGSLIKKGPVIGTQSISTSSFQAYTVDTSGIKKGELARLSFNVSCLDGGIASLAIDDITVTKE